MCSVELRLADFLLFIYSTTTSTTSSSTARLATTTLPSFPIPRILHPPHQSISSRSSTPLFQELRTKRRKHPRPAHISPPQPIGARSKLLPPTRSKFQRTWSWKASMTLLTFPKSLIVGGTRRTSISILPACWRSLMPRGTMVPLVEEGRTGWVMLSSSRGEVMSSRCLSRREAVMLEARD